MKIVKLYDRQDGSKQGVDDYLAAGGSVENLIELSVPFVGLEARDPKWPVMGEEAFYGLAGEVVRTIEPNTESDPAGLAVLVLTVVGNAIGRGAHFKVEEELHYCKLNPVLVGDTSKGRKGTAQNRLNRLVKQVDQEWYENCTASGLSTGEGLIHRLRDPVIVEGEDGELKVVDPGVEDKRLQAI